MPGWDNKVDVYFNVDGENIKLSDILTKIDYVIQNIDKLYEITPIDLEIAKLETRIRELREEKIKKVIEMNKMVRRINLGFDSNKELKRLGRLSGMKVLAHWIHFKESSALRVFILRFYYNSRVIQALFLTRDGLFNKKPCFFRYNPNTRIDTLLIVKNSGWIKYEVFPFFNFTITVLFIDFPAIERIINVGEGHIIIDIGGLKIRRIFFQKEKNLLKCSLSSFIKN